MAHLKILPLVSFLLRPPCPLWRCVRRMEVGGEREEEETGRLVVVVFKAGWDWERRWDGGGPARVRTSGSGRKTSASLAWSVQPGSAGPVSLARSHARVRRVLVDRFCLKKRSLARSFVRAHRRTAADWWVEFCMYSVRAWVPNSFLAEK
jgi:hypothetical protein